MAARGRKPKPRHLKIVTGNPGNRPLPEHEPEPREPLGARPKYLKGRAAALYDQLIKVAWWLGDVDTYKAGVWCKLQTEFERSSEKNPMIAGRIAQLRALGSELGLDPAARSRLGVVYGRKPPKNGKEKPKEKDPYFKD